VEDGEVPRLGSRADALLLSTGRPVRRVPPGLEAERGGKICAGTAAKDTELEGPVHRRHATGLLVGEEIVLDGRVVVLVLGLLIERLGDAGSDNVGKAVSRDPKVSDGSGGGGGDGRRGRGERAEGGGYTRGGLPRGFPDGLHGGETSRDGVKGELLAVKHPADAPADLGVSDPPACGSVGGVAAGWWAVGGASTAGGGGQVDTGKFRRLGLGGGGRGPGSSTGSIVGHVDNSERNRRATPREPSLTRAPKRETGKCFPLLWGGPGRRRRA